MKKTITLLMMIISTFVYGQVESPVSFKTSFNIEGEDGTLYPRIKVYNTPRTAIVLRKVEE